MVANELHKLRCSQMGEVAALLPPEGAGFRARLVEPLQVLALRLLPGGAEAIASAVATTGVDSLPDTGCFVGSDPMVVWRNPGELLFICTSASAANTVLRTLPAASHALAYSIDRSAGTITFSVQGPAVDDVLHRLMDASAVPHSVGQGTRTRMADIAVIVMRIAPDCVWLIADRTNDHYLAHWIAYTAAALHDAT